MSKYAPDKYEEIQSELLIALKDYDVKKVETEIVPYQGDINEKYMKHFLVSKKIAGCTDRTLYAYKNEVSKVLKAINKPATEITTDDIRLCIANKQIYDGISNVYASHILRCVSSFFAHLTDEEVILKNPCLKIPNIKKEKKQKKAFTELEFEKIRDACQTAKERVWVELLLSTGCRVSELASIKIEDIKDNRINVLGKGNKRRYVYLNAKATLTLKEWIDLGKYSEYLFPSREGATKPYVDKGYIEQIVREIGKRAGVSKVHPHRFRRTCATFALKRGMPIQQVSKMLGHESIETTQIYLDLQEEELEIAHQKYVV